MKDELVCARCNQPIRFRELFHPATRAAMLGEPEGEHYIVPGERVTAHDYPCPTRCEIVDGRLLINGMDVGPSEQYTQPQFYGQVTDIGPDTNTFRLTPTDGDVA